MFILETMLPKPEAFSTKVAMHVLSLACVLLIAILLAASCGDTTSAESTGIAVSGIEQPASHVNQQYAWVQTEDIGTAISLEDVRATANWGPENEGWGALAAKIGDGYELRATYYHGATYSRLDSPRVMMDSHPGYVKLTVGWRTLAEQRMTKRKQLHLEDSWRTSRGLMRGDSFERMVELYGIPTGAPSPGTLDEQNRLSRVDYEYIGSNTDQYRLSFYFRGGKVDHVDKWWVRAGLDWANLAPGDLAPEILFPGS